MVQHQACRENAVKRCLQQNRSLLVSLTENWTGRSFVPCLTSAASHSMFLTLDFSFFIAMQNYQMRVALLVEWRGLAGFHSLEVFCLALAWCMYHYI
jgi:hypothetical protein